MDNITIKRLLIAHLSLLAVIAVALVWSVFLENITVRWQAPVRLQAPIVKGYNPAQLEHQTRLQWPIGFQWPIDICRDYSHDSLHPLRNVPCWLR